MKACENFRVIRPRFLERFKYSIEIDNVQIRFSNFLIKTLVDKCKDQRDHTVDKNMISDYAHVSYIDHYRFVVVIAVIWPCTLVLYLRMTNTLFSFSFQISGYIKTHIQFKFQLLKFFIAH